MQTFNFTRPTYDTATVFDGEEVIIAIKNLPPGNWEVVIRKPKRTNPQNSGMHMYFTRVAKALNNAGFDKIQVLCLLGKNLCWSEESVKREIWCLIQVAMNFGKKTRKLKQDQVTKVYEKMNSFITSVLKMESIPFPSKEELYAKQLNR